MNQKIHDAHSARKKQMDKFIFYSVTTIAFIATVLIIFFVFRYLNNIAAPTKVFSPTPGVTCAQVVTGDGVALQCWGGGECVK